VKVRLWCLSVNGFNGQMADGWWMVDGGRRTEPNKKIKFSRLDFGGVKGLIK